MTSPPVDFAALAAALLDRAETLMGQWLPGGKRSGKEWVCGGLDGSAGGSFSVNMNTGAWAEFASDEKGGDLISLYAAIRGLGQAAAARELLRDMGWERAAPPPVQASAEKKRNSTWRSIAPVPEGTPPANFRHFHRGEPAMTWEYRFDGALYGYVCRFETSDGGKETLPRTWCADTGDSRGLHKWHWMQWAEPRPLYVPAGQLATSAALVPVVLVEGEKCAAAGHQLLGSEFDFVSWPGGAKAWQKADWAWLRGRVVYLWPDCDAQRLRLTPAERAADLDPATKPILEEAKQPGMMAMVGIGERLLELECLVHLCAIPAPGAVSDGWDIADAIAAGWDADTVRGFIRGARVFTPAEHDRSNVIEFPGGERSTPTPAGASEPPPARTWRTELLRSRKDAAVLGVRENIVLALDGMPGLPGMEACAGVIGYNEFTNDVVKLRDAPWKSPAGAWQEVDELLMGEWLAHVAQLPSVARATLEEATRMVAYRHRYHPVRAYLTGLRWDGERRLATWLRRTCLEPAEWVDSDPLHQYLARVGTYFLMGMCARAMTPGVKFDYMLILEGPQGRRKSTLLRLLAGEWFADTGLVLGDKDSYQQLQGRWLYEFGELDSFGRAEITRVKSFVASASDYFRASFDRRARDYPRQVVFGGTTNEDHYLTDPTGNRRFWPVRVTRLIDTEWLIENRDQLFAEAMERVRRGARMHPLPDEELELFEPQQRERAVENAIEAGIGRYLYDNIDGQLKTEIGLVELLGHVGIGIEKLGPGRYHEKQAAAALRRMGWNEARSSAPGRPRIYRRPPSAAAGSRSSTDPTQGNNGDPDEPPF